MRKTITMMLAGALAMMVSPALAENFILITHSDGTDPFWPVVQRGAEDAAKQVGATLTYRHPNRVDAVEMAQLIEASITQKPDGMIISILDPQVIGPAIKAAVDAGIPVVSINSGDKFARKYGALFHVGQPETEAGKGAGMRAKAAGVTKHLCVNQEAENIALRERCQGYADALGQPLNMIDATNDPAEIKARTAAALAADPSINGVLATGPHPCMPALEAIREAGMEGKVNVGCFDLIPDIIAALKDGRLAYAVDQQQYLQGYLPVMALDLYTKYGLVPANDILSGPGFVTKDNAAQVEKLAGTIR
jgi:simple sugar transport system substrate-binding protein